MLRKIRPRGAYASNGRCPGWARMSSGSRHKSAVQPASETRVVRECRHSVIGFFDDDILFEPDCIARLWRALQSDAGLGGVNAMITNQRYQSPGRVSRMMFRWMAGRREASYAGRVLGPAVNLLPEDRDDLPRSFR